MQGFDGGTQSNTIIEKQTIRHKSQTMDNILEKYDILLAENEALRRENSELKSLLLAHGISYKAQTEEKTAESEYSPQSFPSVKLSLDERVALF